MNQSAVVELRRYTLRPGQRDTLVELFDDNFVESQEAVGIDLIGQFRELDDPDVFIWIRGFRSMEERAHGLADFYDEEIETEVGRFITLVEPVLLVFMGIVIAIVVLALYMPLFELSSVVGV